MSELSGYTALPGGLMALDDGFCYIRHFVVILHVIVDNKLAVPFE